MTGANIRIPTVRVKLKDAEARSPRYWHVTNAVEIKVFFGILIYMGANPCQRIDTYWRDDETGGPVHLPRLFMSLHRFEQLKRFIHISNPEEDAHREADAKDWYYKLEPMASIFKDAARRYYKPGSNVSIDEIMVRCYGRSNNTYKMPSKPIKQGYKLFCLAEHGYIYSFSWSSRQLGIQETFKYPSLTPTGSMIMDLISKLPPPSCKDTTM